MESGPRHRKAQALSYLGFALFFSALTLANAGQINWRGLANRDHQSSGGLPLTGNVVFELGAFSDGFIPTADNTTSWAEHWSPIDRTFYQASRQLFASTTVVSSNAAPFSIGQDAYIWGYQIDSDASEWILLRKPDWTWPSPNPSALPLSWIVSTTGTEQVLGSINGDAYLKTASVDAQAPLPSLSPDSWRTQHFSPTELDDSEIGSWDADPDGDGLPNQLEYVYACDPRQESQAPLPLAINALSNTATLTLTRPSNRLASYTIEFSQDRTNWSPIDQRASIRILDGLRSAHFTISTEGLSYEFYRCQVAWLSE